jgi:hypothetical protein
VPGTHVHQDLAAFADWLLRTERSVHGEAPAPDSVSAPLL